MAQSESAESRIEYAGVRTPHKSGDSYVVSIPKTELEAEGYDLDEIDGVPCRTSVEDGIMRVNLDDARGDE